MKPLTKSFPGKSQPKRINLLKRGNYMKGAKGWITLPWFDTNPTGPDFFQQIQSRVRNVFPSVIPSPRKRAKSPPLRVPHFLDFPSEWPPSFITVPLIRKTKTKNAYTQETKIVGLEKFVWWIRFQWFVINTFSLWNSASLILADKPSPLFYFPTLSFFFSKEFMSTTPYVINFTIKQQERGNFSER